MHSPRLALDWLTFAPFLVDNGKKPSSDSENRIYTIENRPKPRAEGFLSFPIISESTKAKAPQIGAFRFRGFNMKIY